jgi:hypothetical protein
MGKKASTPATPDYKGAAIATANANKYNTSGPYGTGTWSMRPGADPNNPQAGDWTQTTQLSQEQQQLYDLNASNKLAAGGALTGMVGDLGSRQQIADALYGKATQYMGQAFGDQENALMSRLQNQGLVEGSDAYERAMRNFMQTRGQAYEGAASSAVINADTASNNAVSRIAQLLAATKETVPTGAGVGGGADLLGALQAQYGADLNRSNAKNAQKDSDMQTALQLGATAAMFFSDRRLKSDVNLIGVAAGLPAYEYKIFGKTERGFMADEVQTLYPDAVHEHPSGYLMVDYAKIGGRP